MDGFYNVLLINCTIPTTRRIVKSKLFGKLLIDVFIPVICGDTNLRADKNMYARARTGQ